MRVSVRVNGREYKRDVEPRLLLVHFLRDELGLTGTHVGCDTSNCGACTVKLDGDTVKSAQCSRRRPTGTTSRRSKGSPRTAIYIRCSARSTSATRSSAATARRG